MHPPIHDDSTLLKHLALTNTQQAPSRLKRVRGSRRSFKLAWRISDPQKLLWYLSSCRIFGAGLCTNRLPDQKFKPAPQENSTSTESKQSKLHRQSPQPPNLRVGFSQIQQMRPENNEKGREACSRICPETQSHVRRTTVTEPGT